MLFGMTIMALANDSGWMPRYGAGDGGDSWEDQLSLYANGTLLYIAEPNSSLEGLMDSFRVYGHFLNLGINWDNSLNLPMGTWRGQGPLQRPLQVAAHHFTYLGLWVSKKRTNAS